MAVAYPGSKPTFSTYVDGVDTVAAVIVNQITGELDAVIDELGTDVAGTSTDVKGRLLENLIEAGVANVDAAMSGDLTLVDTDPAFQVLDAGGSSRDINLPAEASANHWFFIRNTGGEDLVVKSDAPATIITIEAGETGVVFSDGTNWYGVNLNVDLSDIDSKLPTTTKGDVLGHSGSASVRLGIGSDGQFLKADSGEASGLIWAGVTVGKQTVWIPAETIAPQSTNGCGAFSQSEVTANQPELAGLDFAGDATEFGQFKLPLPKKWGKGTLSYRAIWSSTATDTDGVAWTLGAVALADGDSLSTAFGTLVTVTDLAQSTANDVYITSESGALTVAGSPSDHEYLVFQIGRDHDHASDTMSEDATLIGLWVYYTTDEETDA